MEDDQAFVEQLVKQIVDLPDKVTTERTVDERGVLITLTVDPTDMGKLIGKEGRTAKAIRTLLRVFGAKKDARVNLKIAEPEGGTGGKPRAAAMNDGVPEAPAATEQPKAANQEQPVVAPALTAQVDEGFGTELI